MGTKKQAQEALKEEAERCGMFYVNQRWIGGTLTNFATIQSRIDHLVRLREQQDKTGGFQCFIPLAFYPSGTALDSLPGPETAAICADQPDVVHLTRPGPVGPSASRGAIAAMDDRELLLFLDDDIVVRPGVVERLVDQRDGSPDTDIVAGGWEEEGSLDRRALVQWFAMGRTAAGPARGDRGHTQIPAVLRRAHGEAANGHRR